MIEKTITLKVGDEALGSRSCLRCKGEDIREVIHSVKVGEFTEFGDEQSQTAIHLAICMGCNRLMSYV